VTGTHCFLASCSRLQLPAHCRAVFL
jgi:hypothetical protein